MERISDNPKHGRSISRAQHENNNNSMIVRRYNWKDESINWYEQYFVNLANYYQNQNTQQKNYCSCLPEFYRMFKTVNNFYFFIEFIDGDNLEDKINRNNANSAYMEQAQALKYIKQLVKFMKLVKKEKLALDCIQAKDIFIPFPLQLKVITQPIYQDRYFYRPILKKNRPDDEEHSQYRAPEKYQQFVRGKPATQFDQNREAKIDQLMEQYNRQINEKAQIWSIGIIFYQMLFNCTPFEGLQLYKAMNEQYILCRNGKNLADFNFKLNFNGRIVSERTKKLLQCLINFDQDGRIEWSQLGRWMKGVNKNGQFKETHEEKYFNQICEKVLANQQIQKQARKQEKAQKEREKLIQQQREKLREKQEHEEKQKQRKEQEEILKRQIQKENEQAQKLKQGQQISQKQGSVKSQHFYYESAIQKFPNLDLSNRAPISSTPALSIVGNFTYKTEKPANSQTQFNLPQSPSYHTTFNYFPKNNLDHSSHRNYPVLGPRNPQCYATQHQNQKVNFTYQTHNSQGTHPQYLNEPAKKI